MLPRECAFIVYASPRDVSRRRETRPKARITLKKSGNLCYTSQYQCVRKLKKSSQGDEGGSVRAVRIKASEMQQMFNLSANGIKLYEKHGILRPRR